MKRETPKEAKIIPGSGAANQIQPGRFDEHCRRQHRVLAALWPLGERYTTEQVCETLRIVPGSAEHGEIIWVLCKALEYRKVSHDLRDQESVWWIEPPHSQDDPRFDLRHTKAVVRSSFF